MIHSNPTAAFAASAIAALTALAKSDTLDETLPALARVRAVLGEQADAWRPLLETLTLRAQERAELKRLVRAAGGGRGPKPTSR